MPTFALENVDEHSTATLPLATECPTDPTAPETIEQSHSEPGSAHVDDVAARPSPSRKRRRSSPLQSPQHAHKRQRAGPSSRDERAGQANLESMRLEQASHEHRAWLSTNGSSPNGSSDHINGTAGKEMNGFHPVDDTATNGRSIRVRQNREPFYGHDREEVTRILLQSLSDLGYGQAARQLSHESGYELEIPSVAAFRAAVHRGEWEDAEAFLLGADSHGLDGGMEALRNGNGARPRSCTKNYSPAPSANGNSVSRNGLPLIDGADTIMLRFLLRQQKYLELIEGRKLNAALCVLRNELTPLGRDIPRLHALSGLIMCPTAAAVRAQAEWDGADGHSRSLLLSQLSASISPAVMIPEHRLAMLLTAVQNEQVLNCQYHNTLAQPSLYTDHECSSDDFPLQTSIVLNTHTDEVWHLDFSPDGSMLATAGKDGLVCVYETDRWKIRHEFREHERSATGAGDRGVCYIAFSPDSKYLISCAQNNEFVVMDVWTGRRVAVGDHFDYPVTTAVWLPNSQDFIVGSQSARYPLGLYSLRSPPGSSSGAGGVVRNNLVFSWREPAWDPSQTENSHSFRVADATLSAAGTKLVVTTMGKKILMYDVPSRRKVGEWQMEGELTSVKLDALGQEMLVNMNKGRVLLLDATSGEPRTHFAGIRQAEHVVRSCFGGAGEAYVVCGGEGTSDPRLLALSLPPSPPTDPLRTRLESSHLAPSHQRGNRRTRRPRLGHRQRRRLASHQPGRLRQCRRRL